MKRVLALAATLVAVAQCTCGVPGVQDDLYPCRTDSDCFSTYQCIGGRCRPKGTEACQSVDCSDPACAGRDCGSNGRTCADRACACSGNGGPAQPDEQACADGSDNDCDGLADCADSTCAGQPCGMGGTCSGTTCVCPAAGNMPQAVESLCGDGLDNDCDGVTDCADPSCANVGCGTSGRICVADAGGCQCGGNGGVREGSESLCGDLADNDCDGETDCADDTCNGATCRANGFICMAMVCACTGNGGTPQPGGETSCTDGFDNDCDGMSDCADTSCDLVSCGAGCRCVMGAKREEACTDTMDNDGDGQQDCADPDCNSVACGMNGLRCSTGACRCVVDGGTVQMMETLCADGRDNDCNGATDCAEAGCDGLACGAGSSRCVGSVCTCFVDGGTVEAAEVSCSDGFDNDCDALTDCADPSCSGASCGDGCRCANGAKTETNCSDAVDNDGDGQLNCGDSNCNRAQCGASAAQVCCGTVCRNLSADDLNCGGCGTQCANNQTCVASTSSGVASGRCTCNNDNQCPLSQSCSASRCSCSAANECAAGQTCGTSTCRY